MPKIEDVSFDEFVRAVFGRRSDDYDEEHMPFSGDHATTVRYLTRLFEESGKLLAAFDDGQIAEGLYFLIDFGASSHMSALKDMAVPSSDRCRWARSLEPLFRDVFAARCIEMFPYDKTRDFARLNSCCGMFFDVLPLKGTDPDPEFNAEMLSLFERLLTVPHVSVVGSALHGLNHWCDSNPERVAGIVDAFLDKNPKLDPKLRDYAIDCRDGYAQ